MDDTELLLASRQLVYSVVARAYAEEPDEAFLAAIMEKQLDVALDIIGDDGDGGHLQDKLDEIRQCIKSCADDGLSACVSGLRAQYVHMFVGPGTLPAAPWESRHASCKSDCSQSIVLAVRNAYRQAGLLPERYRQVADDFVGLEFDFMAKLSSFAIASHQAGDEAMSRDWLRRSEDFLNGHVLAWLDGFAKEMRDVDGGSFYTLITEFAFMFARQDCHVVAAILQSYE